MEIIRKVEPYDCSLLITLFKRSINFDLHEIEKIIENLKTITKTIGYCDCGCCKRYFIDPNSSDWNFGFCIWIQEDKNLIVLDVMKNNEIGAIRFEEVAFGSIEAPIIQKC